MFNAADFSRRRVNYALCVFIVVSAVAVSGCKYILPVDTEPLDAAGVTYDSIQQMKALKISAPEVAEISKAKQGRLSDGGCVEVLKIFHSRGAAFNAGDAVASLLQVGFSEDTIFQLAKLNQLGLGTGEFQAMRLAGLSDEIVLAVAEHRAEGKPVLSGATLAKLKNNGLRESTLVQLAQRSIPDSQAGAIISFCRGGGNDAEVLRRFTGS